MAMWAEQDLKDLANVLGDGHFAMFIAVAGQREPVLRLNGFDSPRKLLIALLLLLHSPTNPRCFGASV